MGHFVKRKRELRMNIYDTANRLAQEIKQSEEYINYKICWLDKM